MGLFSFIKEAGAKIGLGKSKAEEAEKSLAEKERTAKERNKRAAASLTETVSDLGLEAENLKIEITGETAKVSGKVKNQSTSEKIILVVGNSEGVSQVDDNLEVEVKEPEAQFYTVVPGDTLSKIAKTYYGSAMKYPVIFEANKPMLKNPDKIYPGQVLRIPKIDQ